MVLSAVQPDWDATGSVRRDAMARKRELLSTESRDFSYQLLQGLWQ
jgi:hypothetical protein